MWTFAPGTAVEVNLGAKAPDIWYPATVVRENRLGYVVNYKRSEAGFLTVVVDSRHIRPSPPACVNTKFQLLDKVDAFCNFGWSSGVLTKFLSEGRYIVYFKHTRKEKEFKHNDLRLPMMQIYGNRWVQSSQDAAVISEPQESKDINLGDNGKISVLPKNSDFVKESKGVRNGQQEQALPSGKASFDARSVSCMTIEGVTKNEPLHDRSSKESDKESMPKELQLSPNESERQMTPIEQLDPLETLEVPISDLEVNISMEQSENGNEAHAKSVNPRKKLKRRGPGRPRRPESGNPKASVGDVATKKKPVADSFQSYIQKPIVISLPCYNSQWNKLHAQNPSKIPIPDQAEVQEEEKQLSYFGSDGSVVKDVNRGNLDVKGLKNENSAPKRKKGRPFGSLSGVKRKVNETAETLTAIDSARRSTRERKEVYKSAIDTLKSKGKKLKTTNEILSPTQETEANLEEKGEGVITHRIREYVEPVPHGISGNICDDDRPLSTWFGEAHSLPYTKLNPGGNASESGKLDVKVGQMSLVKCNEETSMGNNATNLPSQQYSTTGESDEDKLIDVVVNSLPFIKASPIWKVIESMEVFQQIPQNPHFRPLYDTKEHCREGLAICSMVTFSRLAEDVSKFQFDNPTIMLEDSMETLSDLERQGFSVEPVRSRLNDLLSIKRTHEQSLSLAKEIDEEKKEKARTDQELDEIEKKIAVLREKRELIVLEREKKDSKIGGLQLRFDSVKEALEAARTEFERVATAPW